MKPLIAALLLISSAVAEESDPKALEIAQAMMKAMGGQDAWNKAHFVRFDFIVNVRGHELIARSNLWDKRTGRYRVEDKAENGSPAVVLYTDLSKQQGSVHVLGKKLEGDAAAAALRNSYKSFRNDTLWLAMPWMWTDPGAHLKYAGRVTRDGKPFDAIDITFEHAGDDPGDRYTAYVSPDTHLMEKWDYQPVKGAKRSWDWTYTTTGGIKLAGEHTNAEHQSIGMGKVEVRDKVDDAYFTDPKQAIEKLK